MSAKLYSVLFVCNSWDVWGGNTLYEWKTITCMVILILLFPQITYNFLSLVFSNFSHVGSYIFVRFFCSWYLGLLSILDASNTGPFCPRIHESWWEQLKLGSFHLVISLLPFHSFSAFFLIFNLGNYTVLCKCVCG